MAQVILQSEDMFVYELEIQGRTAYICGHNAWTFDLSEAAIFNKREYAETCSAFYNGKAMYYHTAMIDQIPVEDDFKEDDE